jgi:hypothetical protein
MPVPINGARKLRMANKWMLSINLVFSIISFSVFLFAGSHVTGVVVVQDQSTWLALNLAYLWHSSDRPAILLPIC